MCLYVCLYVQVFIRLLYDTEILDTSDCHPRASFFLEEARPSFKSVPIHMQCLEDLEEYWVHLQYTCLNTRIMTPTGKGKIR